MIHLAFFVTTFDLCWCLHKDYSCCMSNLTCTTKQTINNSLTCTGFVKYEKQTIKKYMFGQPASQPASQTHKERPPARATYLHPPVLPSGGKELSIGREGEGVDCPAVTVEQSQGLPVLHAPQPHRLVT